jgi:RND superfamily putative drug exporter
MVVVFGAFALGEYLVVKMLGLALAAAVFLDATLVRVAVGPALLTLAGRWNWWPGIRRASHARPILSHSANRSSGTSRPSGVLLSTDAGGGSEE